MWTSEYGRAEECRLRVGRQAYMSNFHLDLSSNWILAVKGAKRAVVLHPSAVDCLQVILNNSLESFRQSPLPLLRAREWLAANCPPGLVSQPLAMQHRFEEGDLLYVPALWVHAVANSASDEWWISLNRFMTDPHFVFNHIMDDKVEDKVDGCGHDETLVVGGDDLWPKERPWVS